ncbi:MAG: flippase [Bacteroidia bacterium]
MALIIRFGSFIASYLLVFFIARLYGASVLGTYTLAYTLIQVMAILSLFGLDNLIVRTIATAAGENKKSLIKSAYFHSLVIVISITLIISALFYLFSDYISTRVFHKPHFSYHLKIACFTLLPFVLISFHAACFRGMKNMTGYSIFKLLIPAGTLLSIIIFSLTATPAVPIIGLFISILFWCVVSFIVWFRFAGLKNVLFEINDKPLKILSLSSPMLITGSVFFILGWVDNLCIGIFKSEHDLGIYDTAFKIAAASSVVLMALNAIQAPVFAELHKKFELGRLQISAQSSTRILFYTAFPLTVIICLFPKFILGIFGNEFKEASLCLIILSVGNFISVISGSVGILLQMTGRQKQYNYIVMVAALINVVLNITLIPKLGILGAAIASSISKIFQNIASVIYVKRVFGFTTLYFPLIKPSSPITKNAS